MIKYVFYDALDSHGHMRNYFCIRSFYCYFYHRTRVKQRFVLHLLRKKAQERRIRFVRNIFLINSYMEKFFWCLGSLVTDIYAQDFVFCNWMLPLV